jgi:hypothetical protein
VGVGCLAREVGGTEKSGGVVSRTVSSKLATARFPCASAAEQLTVDVPSRSVAPEAGVQAGARVPSTASLAAASNATAAPSGPVASTANGGGSASTGGLVSRTVTRKVALPAVPCASSAEQETVVVPTGKLLPDTGVQASEATASSGSDALTV